MCFQVRSGRLQSQAALVVLALPHQEEFMTRAGYQSGVITIGRGLVALGLHGGKACGIVLAMIALVGLPSAAAAQPLPYTFAKITDTVVTPAVAGVSCLGMNDLGTVVVHLGDGSLLRGRDTSSLTVVHPSQSGICPSINDSDEIAYMRRIGTTHLLELVRDSNGSEAILATGAGSPALYGATTYLPSLNNAGRAAYVADGGGKIAIGPTGTTLTPPTNYVSPASMNDGDLIAFAAADNSSSKAGLYRGSATPLFQDGDAISGGTIRFSWLQRPGVNNSGTVAFIGRLDVGGVSGAHGVYTTDGSSVKLVGTSLLDRFSLNDSGSVAYRKSSGGGSGLFLGRPGLIDQKVIGFGDALDGSTFNGGFIWEESLNNLGQVAFWAELADGRRGVYVATPKWLNALSFTAKVPACGPVPAKVTLTTIAPPGGLRVDLATTHPSAAIPTHVVVPAGKKTASFSILPTPVLANSQDDIEASHGAQTVSRRLTIRPITVKSVSLTPNPVIGGNAVVGTVKLDCGAQPADLGVTLSSSKPSLAAPTVSSLVIPQGSDSAVFDVTTNPVIASTSATIKASALGTTRSKKLVINP